MAIAEYRIQVPATHGLKRQLRQNLKSGTDTQLSSLKGSVDELLGIIKQASESEDAKQVSEIAKKLDKISEQNAAIIAVLTDLASLIKNLKPPFDPSQPRLRSTAGIAYQRTR
ncbi:MAG: hypothetical protein HYT16_02380 [DPANN group archaeon]|nr:hypothetical protein [DPANN group archaeon]